jgi:hypothetical protein
MIKWSNNSRVTSMLRAATSWSSGFLRCVRAFSTSAMSARPPRPSVSPSRVTSPPAPPPRTTMRLRSGSRNPHPPPVRRRDRHGGSPLSNHRRYAMGHIIAKDEMLYQRYQRANFDDYPNCGESSWGIARSRASYKVCLALSKLAELCDPRLTAVAT